MEIGFINKTDNYKNKIVGNSRILNKENIKYFDNFSFKKVVMADFTDINLELLQEKINLVEIEKDIKNSIPKNIREKYEELLNSYLVFGDSVFVSKTIDYDKLKKYI